MRDITHPSYKDIHRACESMAHLCAQLDIEFKYIVGLSRGGLIPAVILSHLMELPLICIDYSSKEGAGDDKNHNNVLPTIPTQSPFLIVDDICDSGKTLSEVVGHYKQTGFSPYSAVLYYKELPAPVFKPDFHWRKITPDSGWIIFPWESEAANE